MRAGASSGLRCAAGEVVARVRLEGQHAAGHAAMARLVVQQRQHGLVAAVHAVEIADGDGAGPGDAGDGGSLGRSALRDIFLIAALCPCVMADARMACHSAGSKARYIVLCTRCEARLPEALSVCLVVEWRRVLKVLKLSAQGLPQSWISLEQAVLHYAADQVRWEVGGGRGRVPRRHQRRTAASSRSSRSTASSAPRACRNINPFSASPGLTNGKLFARDRNICAYCGGHFHEEDLTREHIIPFAQNGKSTTG